MTRLPFFSFIRKGRECPWGTHSRTRDHHWPIGHYSHQLDSVGWGYHLALEPSLSLPFWLKPRRKWSCSHLTIFVPDAVDTFLNSHHTQHFSVNHLWSFLLTSPLLSWQGLSQRKALGSLFSTVLPTSFFLLIKEFSFLCVVRTYTSTLLFIKPEKVLHMFKSAWS